jgi:threonine/homoserine/homoserine lactone efflux protein
MRSLPEFLVIALLVTITPGPGTATVLRVVARDGRAAALGTILGNSAGVLTWGLLSAAGVSSLIQASQIAYDVLRIGGATVLVVLGARSLAARHRAGGKHTQQSQQAQGGRRRRAGWRAGLVTSLSNPKLAVFFIALFPQFLTRGSPVLPYALAMAATVVALDTVWYSALTYAVDKARTMLRRRVQRVMEQVTGAVMIGLGIRLAIESR